MKNITIIGLGLIGGSLGMAFKEAKPEMNICGVDINSSIIKTAIIKKSIDWGTQDLMEGVKEADLVVVSTFVSSIPQIALEIAPHLKEGCIITDVGSTKEGICNNLSKMLPSTVYFVGGHPMAGSEQNGIKGAKSSLFTNAVYVLTPTEESNLEAVKTVQQLVEAIGARVLSIPPHEHDLMVAGVSHLPHVVAATLVNSVGLLEREKNGILNLAAGGFRDITRIADSEPHMWEEIFLENQDAILKTINIFKTSLIEMENAIINRERYKILDYLTEAQSLRSKIN